MADGCRYKDGGIRKYDGYYSEPVFKGPKNDSTYYNPEIESQCTIPSKSLKELRAEFGIEEEN